MRSRERDSRVVRGRQRPQRALDDVVPQRRTRTHARVTVVRIQRAAERLRRDGIAAGVEARIRGRCRLVVDHLLRRRRAAGVVVNVREPLIHGQEAGLRHALRALEALERNGTGPDGLVRVATLHRVEAGAHCVAAEVRVDLADVMAAQVDDGHAGEVVRLVDRAGTVHVGDAARITDGARRNGIGVEVEAAHPRVEVDELLRRDGARQQRVEAVLHTDVVVRAVDEAVADQLLLQVPHALRPDAEQIGHVVLQIAAHAVGIGGRVVLLRGRDAARDDRRVRL